MDINDDCLFEIFTILNIRELTDVASTSTRFRTIARDVFSFRHKSNCVDIGVGWPFTNGDNIANAYQRQIGPILRNFGDLLTKVKVIFSSENDAKLYNTRVFNMMAKYCTGGLNQLELRCCQTLEPDEIVDARALFRNVKDLVLIRSAAISGSFLSDAKKLTRLNLNWSSFANVVKFLANDYPKLESLSLNNRRMDSTEIDIIEFLKRHPNLTELELSGGGVFDLSSIDECAWLRKISLCEYEEYDISAIAKLNELTSLKLTTTDGDQLPFQLLMSSRSSESLEELELSGYWSYSSDNQMELMISRFTNLQHLSFVFSISTYVSSHHLFSGLHCPQELRALSIGGRLLWVTGDGLVELVQNLPNLEQLSLHPLSHHDEHIHLRESTYLLISEICRARNQKLVIYSFDLTNEELRNRKREEPFAGDDHEVFVRFISLGFNFGTHRIFTI